MYVNPYSEKEYGELEMYLIAQQMSSASNLFFGPEYFFVMKKKKILMPMMSSLRVDMSPAPDQIFSINPDYNLEGEGGRKYNMSVVNGEKGIYDPNEILKGKAWELLDTPIFYDMELVDRYYERSGQF